MIDGVELRIVGHARTPWRRREDAPHQPSAAADAEASIEIEPPWRDALADLGSFSRIWVLFLFHRSRGFATRVRPPRGGPRRGVFATRAPNRPTQLGMSCVELASVDVDEGLVRVRGLDLLDGTPVLDLKPYLPVVDAFPDAGHGWLEPWIERGIEPRLRKPIRPMRD
ncbi:tRNA (N6-threonylcarbamoyladenosine(37)-N6)-methyltransferase TrmO [bacterium]|nr:tRNA (N6-threonylcarbamoyladenosine(37)-N6)-methyltransferase TrmO [bacterium]